MQTIHDRGQDALVLHDDTSATANNTIRTSINPSLVSFVTSISTSKRCNPVVFRPPDGDSTVLFILGGLYSTLFRSLLFKPFPSKAIQYFTFTDSLVTTSRRRKYST